MEIELHLMVFSRMEKSAWRLHVLIRPHHYLSRSAIELGDYVILDLNHIAEPLETLQTIDDEIVAYETH